MPITISLEAQQEKDGYVYFYGYRYIIFGTISDYYENGSISFMCRNVIGLSTQYVSNGMRYTQTFHLKRAPIFFLQGTTFHGILRSHVVCGIFSYIYRI